MTRPTATLYYTGFHPALLAANGIVLPLGIVAGGDFMTNRIEYETTGFFLSTSMD